MAAMRARSPRGLLAGLYGRLLAVATALAFLLGYFATWQHLATVLHVSCPEHQVVEDLPTVQPGAVRMVGIALTSTPARSGTHHPCELPPALRTGGSRAAGPQVRSVAQALLQTSPLPPPVQDLASGVPILLLAPKASPPSA